MRTVEEWVGKNDDSAAPPRVRVRVWERFKGLCAKCTREVGEGKLPFDVDHIIAIALGGQNREANLRPLCKECHKAKTRTDVAIKAVYYAKKLKRAGVKKPSKFACARTSKWKKKVSGEVVLREPR